MVIFSLGLVERFSSVSGVWRKVFVFSIFILLFIRFRMRREEMLEKVI